MLVFGSLVMPCVGDCISNRWTTNPYTRRGKIGERTFSINEEFPQNFKNQFPTTVSGIKALTTHALLLMVPQSSKLVLWLKLHSHLWIMLKFKATKWTPIFKFISKVYCNKLKKAQRKEQLYFWCLVRSWYKLEKVHMSRGWAKNLI